MDQKALKTQVFTNDIIFNESAELPIDVDFMLPDYCPDIVKILKCRAQPMLISKNVSGGTVNLDGNVTITVIYSDADNRICAHEHQFPFNKSFETGCDCDGANLGCRTKCEYINCRAVTGRKIDIHGAAGLYVRLVKRKCSDIIADFDDPVVELRRGSVPATTPMGTVEKYLTVEEEIEIGQGQPAVRALIRHEAEACIRESKLLNEKNIVRGELCVSLLYCPQEGGPQRVKAQLPFSQLLEMPGVTDQCTCDTRAEIACIDIKPRTAATGETRSFILSAKLLVCTTACCDLDIDVVLDAYSRKFEADLKRNEIGFQKISRNIDETCQCKANLDFSEGALAEITDIWCEVQSVNTRVDAGELCMGGTVLANIIAYDEKGIPFYYEKPVDFKCRFPLEEQGNISCEPQIEVRSCSYTLTGSGSMELRLDLGVRAAVYVTHDVSLLSDLTVDERNPVKQKERGAMTIYFAAAGESVWDIARRYRAGIEDIKQINGVDEYLTEDKMIMVPMN